ncbi:hypothetical protein MTR_5g021320 [Medicago truncatula]|uniref:Uncharacterized protein n=1 Tax=Medicago truncatula TaxID=3880 RepID=G7KGC2_MEDTR|nr:hypothetical protein MTR_5g021320 [Medicago truncatula]
MQITFNFLSFIFSITNNENNNGKDEQSYTLDFLELTFMAGLFVCEDNVRSG